MINRIARRALHRLAARAHDRAQREWDAIAAKRYASSPAADDADTEAQARTDAAWTASCDPEFADIAEIAEQADAADDLAREQSATEEANAAAEEGDHRAAAAHHRAAARAA